MPPAPDSIRAFIAVDISPQVRARAETLLGNLKKGAQFTGARPTWVKSENLHFTLFFLGQTPLDKIEKIKTVLNDAANKTKRFELQVSGLGVFPNPKRPRIVWVGVDQGRRQIRDLQGEVVKGLFSLGYEPDNKPFHPHLTLARIKSPKGQKGLLDVIEQHKGVDCGSCEIERLILFKSDLRPEGAKYTPLHEVSLQPA